MATHSKVNEQNVMTEDAGGGVFPSKVFNAPAVDHQRLPVSYAQPNNTDTFTILPGNRVVSIDATLHACSAILPPAKGNNGLDLYIKNRKGGNTVTITPTGSDKIDDHLSVALANRGDVAHLVAVDNDVETGWLVIGCCTTIS